MGNSERKVELQFNTAITGLSEESGKWDEKSHNATVMPLRGLVMQIDGVSGCFIGRYAIEVNYMSGVVSRTAVVKAVRAAVREVASKEGFFPLRGKKTPAARLPKPPKPTHNTWWVARAVFDTDLFIDRDEASTTAIKNKLITRLAQADGARKPGVGQRGLWVKFDRRQVNPESLQAHVEAVVAEIMTERREGNKDYFPFADPTIRLQAYATSYVIGG